MLFCRSIARHESALQQGAAGPPPYSGARARSQSPRSRRDAALSDAERRQRRMLPRTHRHVNNAVQRG